MATLGDIIKEVRRLGPEDFLKLRTALDRVEERLWKKELDGVTGKHRKRNLTDAKIDDLVMKRRYRGRQT